MWSCWFNCLTTARRSLRLPRFGVLRTRLRGRGVSKFFQIAEPARDFSSGSQSAIPLSADARQLRQIDLSENSQREAYQQNHKHCTKPYACATACAPPAVPVVSSAQAEYQHKNKDEYEHFSCPPLSGLQPRAYVANSTTPRVLTL